MAKQQANITRHLTRAVVAADSSIELTRAQDREYLALVMQKLRTFGALEAPLKSRIKAPQFLGARDRTQFAILQHRTGIWSDDEGRRLLKEVVRALKASGTIQLRSPLQAIAAGSDAGVAELDRRWLGDGDRMALIAVEAAGPPSSLKWLQSLQVFTALVAHVVGDSGDIQLTPISVRHSAFNFLKPDAELAEFKHSLGRWWLRVAGRMNAEDLASLALPAGWRLKFAK